MSPPEILSLFSLQLVKGKPCSNGSGLTKTRLIGLLIPDMTAQFFHPF